MLLAIDKTDGGGIWRCPSKGWAVFVVAMVPCLVDCTSTRSKVFDASHLMDWGCPCCPGSIARGPRGPSMLSCWRGLSAIRLNVQRTLTQHFQVTSRHQLITLISTDASVPRHPSRTKPPCPDIHCLSLQKRLKVLLWCLPFLLNNFPRSRPSSCWV